MVPNGETLHTWERSRRGDPGRFVGMDADPGAPGPSDRAQDRRRAVAHAMAPLVLLDLDGTLAPIVAHPDRSRVDAAAIRAIRALLGGGIRVGVVTGRPSRQAERLLRVDGVEIAGLYGLEGAPPVPGAVLERLEGVAGALPGAWVEPKGATAAIHVRESPSDLRASFGPELERIARDAGMEVHPGKAVFDLVPAGVGRKGTTVERMAEGADAVVYAGDDLPDLEAFGALDRLAARGVPVVRIAVAAAGTPVELIRAADAVLPDPAALGVWLEALAGERQTGGRT